jgi:hypothetical protein
LNEQPRDGHRICPQPAGGNVSGGNSREIELLAGIQTAREQSRRQEGIRAEDARKLVDTWALK